MRCELMRGGATFALIAAGWAEVHPVICLPHIIRRYRAMAHCRRDASPEAGAAVAALVRFRQYIEREAGR